jgi:hypothetical protein
VTDEYLFPRQAYLTGIIYSVSSKPSVLRTTRIPDIQFFVYPFKRPYQVSDEGEYPDCDEYDEYRAKDEYKQYRCNDEYK